MLEGKALATCIKRRLVVVLVLVALNCLCRFFMILLVKLIYELLVNNNILKRYLLLK